MAQHDRHPADEAELDRDERELPDEPRGADEEEFDDAEVDEEDLEDEEEPSSFPDRQNGPGY